MQFGPDEFARVSLFGGWIVERRERRGAGRGWEPGSQQRRDGENRRQSVNKSCMHCVDDCSERQGASLIRVQSCKNNTT
jgi:hypothetical protein